MLHGNATFRVLSAAASILGLFILAGANPSNNNPTPKSMSLDTKSARYIPVLSGPPESYALNSGSIRLAPGESVGKHSTEDYEELVIVLEGEGEMVSGSGTRQPMKANYAYYNPPHTEHDVRNTGKGVLRYVYVVTKVK